MVQHNANDPIWARNREFVSEVSSGCGFDMSAYPGITWIGGWTNDTVSLAYRDYGQGRLWLVEHDWQDQDVALSTQSVDLMNSMIIAPISRRPCSEVATDWCLGKGWRVSGAPASGNLICTAPNVVAGQDCNACDTYNVVNWTQGLTDRYCGGPWVANAGDVYSGHSPCECGDNLDFCETFPLDGCIPD